MPTKTHFNLQNIYSKNFILSNLMKYVSAHNDNQNYKAVINDISSTFPPYTGFLACMQLIDNYKSPLNNLPGAYGAINDISLFAPNLHLNLTDIANPVDMAQTLWIVINHYYLTRILDKLKITENDNISNTETRFVKVAKQLETE